MDPHCIQSSHSKNYIRFGILFEFMFRNFYVIELDFFLGVGEYLASSLFILLQMSTGCTSYLAWWARSWRWHWCRSQNCAKQHCPYSLTWCRQNNKQKAISNRLESTNLLSKILKPYSDLSLYWGWGLLKEKKKKMVCTVRNLC